MKSLAHRLHLTALVLTLASGCGGSQTSSTTAAESTGTHQDGAASGGGSGGGRDSQEGGTGGGDSSGAGEFQLATSDSAEQAHGDHPSQITATSTSAAMRLFVVDPDTGPSAGVVIKLTAPDGHAYYTGETDSVGYAEVLVPAGQRYELEYLSLGRRSTTAHVEVPAGPNQDIRLTLRHRSWHAPPRPAPPPPPPVSASEPAPEPPPPAPPAPAGLVLEGILFESGSATIQAESSPRLDRVVEYLTHMASARIRISGHTDDVGDRRANQRLSQARAEAVRDYLVAHGIDRGRLEAVGYGSQQPVASNDTEEGRQQNRRIEAEEL